MNELDTSLLAFLILLQSPIYSFIKMGIVEAIIKPLAVRRTQKILAGLKDKDGLLRRAWDALDYSLPDSADNFLRFMGDSADYIWETVMSELREEDLTTEQKDSLVSYLIDNWDQEAFLSKVYKRAPDSSSSSSL